MRCTRIEAVNAEVAVVVERQSPGSVEPEVRDDERAVCLRHLAVGVEVLEGVVPSLINLGSIEDQFSGVCEDELAVVGEELDVVYALIRQNGVGWEAKALPVAVD